MSQIINELAAIEVDNEALMDFDMDAIYQSFSKNYRKLDDLKQFRSNYEKKTRFMRWWHNDKLRDAELDSVAVQAEFSKAIGQLMVISILQSKDLAEHQEQLNEQQCKLMLQADGIERHAGELQQQHQVLSEQSKKLETLVHEYFALKGLTEDGANRLIEIANEIKATKNDMLQEFSVRADDMANHYAKMRMQMEALSTGVSEQITLISAKFETKTLELQNELRAALSSAESALRKEHLVTQHETEGRIAAQSVLQKKLHELQIAKNAEFLASMDALFVKLQENTSTIFEMKNEMSTHALQQSKYQVAQERFEKETSSRFNRLLLMVVTFSIVLVALICGVAYF